MNQPILVGCIDKLKENIHTRFFYVNLTEEIVKDVTQELCLAIDDYNAHATTLHANGHYALTIPYKYKNGMAVYPFGCGLAHYLQEEEFQTIENRVTTKLSFPLAACRILMYTPFDIKDILGCWTHWEIADALESRYFGN